MSKKTGSGPPTPDVEGLDPDSEGLLPGETGDAVGEAEVSALDSGAPQLSSVPLVGGLSGGSADWSWAYEFGGTDANSGVEGAAANAAGGQNTDGLAGGPTSMLSSPNLLALNSTANPDTVADVGPNYVGSVSSGPGADGDQKWVGFYTDPNGVTWDQFVHPDGTLSATPSGGGPIVFSGLDIARSAPGAPLPADFVPDPADAAPTPAPTPSPVPTPSPSPTLAPSQSLAPSPAPAPDPPTPPPFPASAPTQALATQPSSPMASQQDADWSAAKAGMWDSLVDLVGGIANAPRSPFGPLGPLGLLVPEIPFDWAKFGPPPSTGDSARDADLLDNYQRGGWVTTTISMAAPIGAEGLLDSALAAAGRLPSLGGAGLEGGVADELGTLGREINGSVAPEAGSLPTHTEVPAISYGRSVDRGGLNISSPRTIYVHEGKAYYVSSGQARNIPGQIDKGVGNSFRIWGIQEEAAGPVKPGWVGKQVGSFGELVEAPDGTQNVVLVFDGSTASPAEVNAWLRSKGVDAVGSIPSEWPE